MLLLNLVAFEFLRSSHDVAVHTRKRYRQGEVVALLERAGFEVERATYRLCLLFPLVALCRLLKRLTLTTEDREAVASDVARPAPLLNRILLSVSRLENRLLSRFDLPVGTSVFAVARKPRHGARCGH